MLWHPKRPSSACALVILLALPIGLPHAKEPRVQLGSDLFVRMRSSTESREGSAAIKYLESRESWKALQHLQK